MTTTEPSPSRPDSHASARRFGVYAATREVYSGALASMYLGQAGAGEANPVAIKFFHPPAATTLQRALAREGFLAAAEEQRAAGAAGATMVAPVLDAGAIDGGCYVVRPYYRLSLQFVSDAHIAPDIERLHRVVRTMVSALAEWERATGRPHGNFKPSNVFFETEPSPGAPWRLVLVDPWFTPGLNGEKRQARDLEQLGRWIVRWVRRRDAVGWQIEQSPEWNILGRAATPWREFCNSLLDPNAPAETRRFDAVLERLDRIPATPPGKWIPKAAAGGLAAASLAVAAYARWGDFAPMPGFVRPLAEKLGNPGARVDVVPPQFGELCTEWDRWLAALLELFENDAVRQRWQADPQLAGVLQALTRPIDLDPRAFTGETNRRFEALRDSPPDAAKRTVVVEKVMVAHATVGRVARALSEWPGWKSRSDALAEWTAQGWTAAAAAHALPAPPELVSGKLGQAIDDALVRQVSQRGVFAAWSGFKTDAAALQATGDPIQGAMPAFYAAGVGDPPDAAEFASKLGAAAGQLKTRGDFARGDFARRVDRERYLRESLARDFRGPLTAEVLTQWERSVPEYFRVEGAQDPRTRVEWERLLTEIDTTRTELASAEAEDPTSAATVAVKSGMVASDATAARDRLRAVRTEVILVKDVARATETVTALERDVTALLTRARDALDELQPNIDKLKAWIRNRAFAGEVFRAAWTDRANRIAGDAEAADRAGNRDRFKQLGRAARALASYFTSAEKAIQELGGVALGEVVTDIKTDVNRLEAQRRDELARAVLAETTFRNEAPATDWASALAGAAIGGRFNEYRRWQQESSDFARELSTLGARLSDGFGWTEGVATDFAALARRAQTAALEALGGATAEWIRTARRLESLQSSSDPALLRSAAAEPALSVRLTAWRRLGELPEWPSGTTDLELEGTLTEEIGRQVEALAGGGGRQQALRAELREQSKLRWNRAARRVAPVEAQLTAVLDLMAKRAIPRDDLEADVRFNFGLRQLKTVPFTRLPTAELRQKRDEFLAEIRRLPVVGTRADVVEFIRLAEDCDLSGSTRPLTPRELGPAATGWNGEFAADAKRVTFRWKSPARGGPDYAMDYVLVEPTDSTPFFLAVEAVPVGAFIDLLEYHPGGGNVPLPYWVKDIAEGKDKDNRRFPQTWEIETGQTPQGTRMVRSYLKLSSEWLPNPDPQWPKDLYAKPAEAPRPTRRSPIQSLPPDVARKFVTEVLGARLPTPEEWQAVGRMYAAEVTRGNFRDEAWMRQLSYVVKEGRKEQSPWPDAGMFVPPSLANIKRRDAAEPAVQKDDSTLWFNTVDDGPEIGGIRNLFGNVAIYLFDETTSKFAVAGGSAISPPEIDPLKTYDLPRNSEDGFADVGFRPAFDASPELIQRAKLMRIVRQQRFLTP